MIYIIGLIGCYTSYLILGFAPSSQDNAREINEIQRDINSGNMGHNKEIQSPAIANTYSTVENWSCDQIMQIDLDTKNTQTPLHPKSREYTNDSLENMISDTAQEITNEITNEIAQEMTHKMANEDAKDMANKLVNEVNGNTHIITGESHSQMPTKKQIFMDMSMEIQQYKQPLIGLNRIGALLQLTYLLWIFSSYMSMIQNTGGNGDIAFMDGLCNICKDSLLVELFLGVLVVIMLLTMGSPTTKEMIENIPQTLMIITNVLGLIYLLNSNDWVVTITAWELMNLSLYLLVTMQGNSSTSSALSAGLKYFLLSALTTAFLLMGIGLIYGQTGSTNYDILISFFHMQQQLNIDTSISDIYMNPWYRSDQRSNIGLILIIVTLLFKLGAAPFHNWAPDLYDSLPTSITMYVSLIPKIAILLFMMQPIILISTSMNIWSDGHIMYNNSIALNGIASVSVLSILIGSIGLISQWRIKRFITYSAISHLGFILLAYISLSLDSYLYYIFIYGFTNILFFTIIKAIGDTIKGNYGDIIYIRELAGIYKLNPPIAIALSLTLFSLAGIPPLGGFFAKLLVLQGLCSAYQIYIAIIIILASAIAAACYLHVISLMLLDLPIYHSPHNKVRTLHSHNALSGLLSISPMKSYLVSLITTFLIFFYINSSTLLSLLTGNIASQLLQV